MPDPLLRAIPYPQPTLDSIKETVLALKVVVELLAGMKGIDAGRSARYEELLAQFDQLLAIITAKVAEVVALIPAPASTTEVLTGTNAVKYGTPDSIAALWEAAPTVTTPVSGDVTIGDGGYFVFNGAGQIDGLNFAVPKSGRRIKIYMNSSGIVLKNLSGASLNKISLPGNADITSIAGDTCEVLYSSASFIPVLWYYRRGSGKALVPPTASEVPFTPTGTIAANNVQAAIAEVNTENVAKAGDTMTGPLTIQGCNYTIWNSTNTDIDAIIPGSASGQLIQGIGSGHQTFALRENDSTDGWQWISGGGNWSVDNIYDTLAMSLTCAGELMIKGGINAAAGNFQVRGSDGDLLTNLVINKASPAFSLDGITGGGQVYHYLHGPVVGGVERGIRAYSGSTERWRVVLGTTTAESGSNAGSNFAINRYDDAGAALGAVLSIIRSSGNVSFFTDSFTIGGSAAATSFHIDGSAGGTATFTLSGPAGTTRYFGRIRSGALDRWRFYVDSAAEAGSDAGSDFNISRINDAASVATLWLRGRRSDGSTMIGAPSGGHKGANTLNVEGGIWDNGVDLAASIALKAPLASPALTGNPTAPTPAANDNDTSIATTAYVRTEIAGKINRVNVARFTATGTYTPSTGMKYVIVRCRGGGGGGGGAVLNAGGGGAGGGGGQGEYREGVINSTTVGASQSVTIGAGGAAGTSAGGNGGTGGTTSFGSIFTALGGGGGEGAVGSAGSGLGAQSGGGGSGGTGGQIAYRGTPGHCGLAVSASIRVAGNGGGEGGGNGPQSNGSTGTGVGVAGNLGGGGSGGLASTTVSAAGGAGGAGWVEVTEFISDD